MPYIPAVFHRRYLTAFALASLPLAVMAETQSTESNTLGTITVIADRYDDEQPGAEYLDGQVSTGGRVGVLGQMDGYDAPFNLIRYNKELLEDQQVESLSDIANFDAGVHTYMGYGNFSEQFVLRGFLLNGDDVLYGGLYGVVPRQIVLADIAESIEVLKGPSAFANGVSPGGSGVGGSINVEPKYAGDDETQVGLSYSNNTYVSTRVDTSRHFGSQDQLGVRLSAVAGQGGTAIEDEEKGDASVYAGVDYETERSHTYMNAGYMRTTVDNGRPAVLIGGGLTDIPDAPDANTGFKADWTYFESDNLFGIVRHEQVLTDRLSAYAAFGANRTWEEGSYGTPTLNDTDGSATVMRMDTAFIAQTYTGQLGVESRLDVFNMEHRLNLGYSGVIKEAGDFSEYTFNTEATNIFDPVTISQPTNDTTFGAGSFDDPEFYRKTVAHGVALTDQFDLLDALLNVTAGIRYQSMTTTNDLSNTEYEGDAFSPVLGLNVHPLDSLTLYANYVEGLQEGSVAPSDANNKGENIGLKHTLQYEAGAKLDLGAVGGSVALYQIEQPSAFKDADGNYGYHGEQRSRGLEMNAFGDPMARLHLLSSLAITDAVLTKTETGANEGNKAMGVPEYRLVVGAGWDMTKAWDVSARVIHTGPQAVNVSNTLELDPWTRLDLSTSYDTQLAAHDLTLRANIENVTNENYWSGVGADYGQISIGAPLTATLSATMSF